MTKEEMLRLLTAAYTGPGSAAEGTFAGDVLRACADGMAQLWSMEIDGLERRAFVSSAVGEWLTAVCADRGCVRKEGETDEELRARTLAALAATSKKNCNKSQLFHDYFLPEFCPVFRKYTFNYKKRHIKPNINVRFMRRKVF